MVKEFKDLGTLLEVAGYSPEFKMSVKHTYRAVQLDGQAWQQLIVTDASGSVIEARLLSEWEFVTPHQITAIKAIKGKGGLV